MYCKILFNDQLDANSFLYMFISVLYIFRAFKCSSSGDSIVSIRYLVYITLTDWYAGLDVPSKPAYQTVRVTYTRYRIDTIESPDDEHLNARKM